MPIYPYRCKACGAQEEHLQRISDPPIASCSSCGGPLEKRIAAAAFHLKGGGWYKDGYASAKPGSASESSSASSGSDSSGSGSSGTSSSDAPKAANA